MGNAFLILLKGSNLQVFFKNVIFKSPQETLKNRSVDAHRLKFCIIFKGAKKVNNIKMSVLQNLDDDEAGMDVSSEDGDEEFITPNKVNCFIYSNRGPFKRKLNFLSGS